MPAQLKTDPSVVQASSQSDAATAPAVCEKTPDIETSDCFAASGLNTCFRSPILLLEGLLKHTPCLQALLDTSRVLRAAETRHLLTAYVKDSQPAVASAFLFLV